MNSILGMLHICHLTRFHRAAPAAQAKHAFPSPEHHGGRRLGPTSQPPRRRVCIIGIGICNTNSVRVGPWTNTAPPQAHSEKGAHQVAPRLPPVQAAESQVPGDAARMLQLHAHRPGVRVPQHIPGIIMARGRLVALGPAAVDPHHVHRRRHALLPSLPPPCLPAHAHPRRRHMAGRRHAIAQCWFRRRLPDRPGFSADCLRAVV
ncbi:hypothetical protein BT67DRAFT_288130 [Trichocladium antarcticum]|uniref:Uncharacterized protein n=1 Tax=Trichocladium antarcticum TaxID=1450529 RepID=A0AAN6ULU2_9PEZI|nr:hypothetical protein BT67DRAFT_288130 [Trichocladium antarcticum]